MRRLLRPILALALGLSGFVGSVSAQVQIEVATLSEVGRVPLGTLRMGDYVFVSPATLDGLGVEVGSAVRVRAGDHEVEARVSCLARADEMISIRLSLREALGVEPGPAAVELWPLAADETSIVPEFAWPERATALEGDLARWAGVALGAPHGGCDFHTEEVARRVNELAGVPTMIYEGARFSYIGRWKDVSRPAGLRSVGGWKVGTSRQTDPEFAAAYKTFQSGLHRVAGAAPLAAYLELHGHGLRGTDELGESVSRDVIEGASVGFGAEELEQLVAVYEASSRAHGREDVPPLMFFELGAPADEAGHRSHYTWHGAEYESRWAAMDTRLLGTLNPENALSGIQLETPNSMRFEPEEREITARVLVDLLAAMQAIVQQREGVGASAVEASVRACRKSVGEQLVRFPAGEAQLGAARGVGLAAEHPQHLTSTSAFAIEATEVTASALAAFLQRELDRHEVSVTGGRVLDRAGHVLARVAPAVAFSTCEFTGGRFHARLGREAHPAVHVSWFGAMAFAREVGLDLPTEAEWERAAQTGNPPSTATANNRGYLPTTWQAELLPLTDPVASHTASPEGVYDLGGNVWEWCSDWYDQDAYAAPSASRANPTGPAAGSARVLRGGGWRSEPFALRASVRQFADPENTMADTGFRCVSHQARP